MPDTFGRALWLRSIKAAEMASGQPIPGLMPWDRPEKMAAPPKGPSSLSDRASPGRMDSSSCRLNNLYPRAGSVVAEALSES